MSAPVQPVVHTPGPWIVDHVVRTFTPNCTSSVYLIKRKDRRDVDVPTWLAELSDRENSHEDANLIAASPTMLEALIAINEATNPFFEDDPLKLHRARIAVQQAIKLAGHKVV